MKKKILVSCIIGIFLTTCLSDVTALSFKEKIIDASEENPINHEIKKSNSILNIKEPIVNSGWDSCCIFKVLILNDDDSTVEIEIYPIPDIWMFGTFDFALVSQQPIYIGAKYGVKIEGYYRVEFSAHEVDLHIDGKKHEFEAYWYEGGKKVYQEDYEKEVHWDFPPFKLIHFSAVVEVVWRCYNWDGENWIEDPPDRTDFASDSESTFTNKNKAMDFNLQLLKFFEKHPNLSRILQTVTKNIKL